MVSERPSELHETFSSAKKVSLPLEPCAASDEYINAENAGSSAYVEISTAAAISFVVIASCFLVMLYKLMAYWFVEVLVVLFCKFAYIM